MELKLQNPWNNPLAISKRRLWRKPSTQGIALTENPLQVENPPMLVYRASKLTHSGDIKRGQIDGCRSRFPASNKPEPGSHKIL